VLNTAEVLSSIQFNWQFLSESVGKNNVGSLQGIACWWNHPAYAFGCYRSSQSRVWQKFPTQLLASKDLVDTFNPNRRPSSIQLQPSSSCLSLQTRRRERIRSQLKRLIVAEWRSAVTLSRSYLEVDYSWSYQPSLSFAFESFSFRPNWKAGIRRRSLIPSGLILWDATSLSLASLWLVWCLRR